MDTPVTIVVTNEKVTFQQGIKQPAQAEKSSDGLTWTITATNNRGVTLPSTGGIGTHPFTILGLIFIAGAVLLLWRRQRTM